MLVIFCIMGYHFNISDTWIYTIIMQWNVYELFFSPADWRLIKEMYGITSRLRAQREAEAVQTDHPTMCPCCPCYAAKKVSSIKLPGNRTVFSSIYSYCLSLVLQQIILGIAATKIVPLFRSFLRHCPASFRSSRFSLEMRYGFWNSRIKHFIKIMIANCLRAKQFCEINTSIHRLLWALSLIIPLFPSDLKSVDTVWPNWFDIPATHLHKQR